MYAIETKGLTKLFGGTVALRDVSLAVEPGKIVGLLGRNGAGKTTLLNIIANKLFASAGEVFVDGLLAAESAEAQAKIYYMTEKNLFPGGMRVRELFFWTREFYPEFDEAYARGLADKFALGTAKKFRELSTGYRSILKLILALSSGAEIILLDEPVLGLDANHRALFYKELIARYSQKPATYIVSTHLIDEVADVLEEAIIIKNGSVIAHQSVEELRGTAYTVSGEAEAVDRFTAGRKVIASESMARFKSVTVHEPLSAAMEADAHALGLELGTATLQKLFVDLTNE